jgi:uncharacterized repeat protein (TIGR01451 family)
MHRSAAVVSLRLVVVWLFANSGLAGCAHMQIPAIDPTGQGLFAGTTSFEKHHGLFHKHHAPQPAAVAPVIAAPPLAVQPVVVPPAVVQPAVVPPPCAPPIQTVPVVPVGCGPQQMLPQPSFPQTVLPAQPAMGGPIVPPCPAAEVGPELKVTPARIVAAVNTEVILAAGICGPNGYYVTRQPLEWMLAQDGAGQFVAVGHESPHDVSFLLRNSPQKVATNYARAHTSTISQILDRGTPTPADDVALDRGQSWISLTSPTEGTSHVVVWAPKEQNWDRRKATATVYWVNAAWRFPPPTTVRAGARHPLATVLTRASGEPISGWIVRYEVLEGPPAAFGGRGERAIEIRTDGAGRAIAELLPGSMEPGITAVRVQIIRPGTARGDLPQMVVGQGVTPIQWTTPGLSVRALSSSTIAADGAIGYRVEVTNNGDLMTRGVELSFTPPPGVAYLNSTPPAQTFGQRLAWRLGDLPPRMTSVVELNCRAGQPGSIRSTFVATGADQLRAEDTAVTDVRVNALSVRMNGPEVVPVGSEARFEIDVTNTGNVPLTNVTASDMFDPGLAHAGGEQSPLVRSIAASLAPGQTERFAVSFIVTQAGRQCHRLDVTADGGQAAAARGCVTGTAAVAAPPQLTVRVNGPATRRAGELAEYSIEVRNTGSTPATNVDLVVNWGFNLQFEQATQGHETDVAGLRTRWRVGQLAGGEATTRRLNCRCLNPDERASVKAVVTSQQTSSVTHEALTAILPGVAATPTPRPAPPGPLPGAPPPSAAGTLKITASAQADPIVLNGTTTYVITVQNDRSAADQDLALSVQIEGDGLAIVRIPGSPVRALRSSAASVDFEPVQQVRAGEQLPPFRIEIQGVKPGRHKLRISATSALSPSGVVSEAETTVTTP